MLADKSIELSGYHLLSVISYLFLDQAVNFSLLYRMLWALFEVSMTWETLLSHELEFFVYCDLVCSEEEGSPYVWNTFIRISASRVVQQLLTQWFIIMFKIV